MTTVVISQPMFLPWIGMFEQIKQADIFVHYDDVQRSKGSFTTRVQVLSENGTKWLTAPIDKVASGRLISETKLIENDLWKEIHFKTLQQYYSKRPYAAEMLSIVNDVYSNTSPFIAQFDINAMELISNAIGLKTKFMRSSEMNIPGSSTQRVVDICKTLGATRYITGHGARNYLEHDLFESVGIDVLYMDYRAKPWDQGNAEFTPYVTILDTISSVSTSGVKEHMTSGLTHWRDFVSSPC